MVQVLRAESRQLSVDEVRDALSHHISYGVDDVVIVDWNAALVVDNEPEDVLTVLEFANVELLEMRFLDQRLDEALGLAYERLNKRSRRWFRFRSNPSDLRDISQWQVDSAILFEGVNNVLKLIGDQYLARLYRLVGERFHLTEWDASILRKLQTLEGIYEKISDQVGHTANGGPGVDHHRPVCNIDRAAVSDGGPALSCDDPLTLPGLPYVFGYRSFERTFWRKTITVSRVSGERDRNLKRNVGLVHVTREQPCSRAFRCYGNACSQMIHRAKSHGKPDFSFSVQFVILWITIAVRVLVVRKSAWGRHGFERRRSSKIRTTIIRAFAVRKVGI